MRLARQLVRNFAGDAYMVCTANIVLHAGVSRADGKEGSLEFEGHPLERGRQSCGTTWSGQHWPVRTCALRNAYRPPWPCYVAAWVERSPASSFWQAG